MPRYNKHHCAIIITYIPRKYHPKHSINLTLLSATQSAKPYDLLFSMFFCIYFSFENSFKKATKSTHNARVNFSRISFRVLHHTNSTIAQHPSIVHRKDFSICFHFRATLCITNGAMQTISKKNRSSAANSRLEKHRKETRKVFTAFWVWDVWWNVCGCPWGWVCASDSFLLKWLHIYIVSINIKNVQIEKWYFICAVISPSKDRSCNERAKKTQDEILPPRHLQKVYQQSRENDD